MSRFQFSAIAILLVLAYGCNSTNEPENVTSCNSRSNGVFVEGNGWLQAGSNLFSISDPFNPLLHIATGYGYQFIGDTTFIVGPEIYTVNYAGVTFDTIGSTISPRSESLSANATHLAFAPGYIYFIRNTRNSSGSNPFCSRSNDTVTELDVDSFSDTSYAGSLLSKFPLTDPDDIAIKDSILFVLDGSAGLKSFSLSDPAHPSPIATAANIQGYHMQITDQSTLLITSMNGIEQYDISNPSSPTLLSNIQ